MSQGYILHKRRNTILYTEFLFMAAGTGMFSSIYMLLHPVVGVLIGGVFALLIAFLFFNFRIFRYSFSLLFSIAWAVGMYLVGKKVDSASDTTSWILAAVGFCMSLWTHWNHFHFIRNARLFEYERN
jgi:hypothetical protein